MYEIIGTIGAGGMGEVYRARDTRLQRDVALKILPEIFAVDPDRIARFEREAQVLASLNHPHIAAIYGIEESAGVRALVLELVSGDTLADRITRGPIPVDETLPIATQIAQALEAAHEQGIIHRDLKPANIKVTSDGVVKVLDLGLAKLAEPSGSIALPSTGSVSPTITSPALMTQAGVLLGTAAYMAPEQAKGRPADKRSDIWAFGCVLYEMLTAKRAFPGDDIAETLASVIKTEPDWTALPPDVPGVLVQLLGRLLEKDRRLRLHDIGDAALDLRAAPGASEPVVTPRGHSRRTIVLASAFTFCVGALAAAAVAWLFLHAVPPRISKLTIPPSEEAAFHLTGYSHDLAITPDGSRVVFAANGGNELIVRRLDSVDFTRLVKVGHLYAPFISPDGRWVGFFDLSRTGGTLKKIPLEGGPVSRICDIEGTIDSTPAWGSDNTIVFSTVSRPGLQRVSADGGTPTALTTPLNDRGEGAHAFPQFLRGTSTLLFTIFPSYAGNKYFSIFRPDVRDASAAVLNVSTGQWTVVAEHASAAQYVPSGHLIYRHEDAVYARRFDAVTETFTGEAVPISSNVAMDDAGGFQLRTASNGTMAYISAGVAARPYTLTWVDRAGKEEPIDTPPRAYQYPRLSPDETQIALDVFDQHYDIWMLNVADGGLRRLTMDTARSPSRETYPVWFGNTQLIFASNRNGSPNLFVQPATESAEMLPLTSRSTKLQYPYAVTRDGKQLLFREDSETTGSDIFALELTGSGRQLPLVTDPGDQLNPELSPNQKWLAYESDQSGEKQIWVRSFRDVSPWVKQVTTDGGTRPAWSKDGTELFYVSLTNDLMVIPVGRGQTFTHRSAVKLLDGKRYFFGQGTGASGRTYDVRADGKFLMIKQQAPSVPIWIVQNWFTELKQRVPTR